MKVLVADTLPEQALAEIEAAGFELVSDATLDADALCDALQDVNVLIVRSTKVTAAALDTAAQLRLVIRAGAGVSNIDVAHASDLGVFVANCPGKNAVAVAELTIGLLLSLDRRIPAAHAELRDGRWNKKEYGRAAGLHGRVFGIVGAGQIGRATAERAKALRMRVIAWDRALDRERADELGIGYVATLEELARACDAMSVHLPLTDSTRHIIGPRIIAAMKPGAFLINVSRGGIVDEGAVLDALEAGRIRYATDVFEDEPSASQTAFDAAIASHPDAICTPHIGASTDQAQQAVAAEAIRVLRAFRDQGVVPNCLNLCEPEGGWQLTVRHLNQVGVLATVLALLRDAHINVEELENMIFTGEVAACAKIQLSGEPSAEVIAAVRACSEVIGASLRPL